jgi:hypothetical protein
MKLLKSKQEKQVKEATITANKTRHTLNEGWTTSFVIADQVKMPHDSEIFKKLLSTLPTRDSLISIDCLLQYEQLNVKFDTQSF